MNRHVCAWLIVAAVCALWAPHVLAVDVNWGASSQCLYNENGVGGTLLTGSASDNTIGCFVQLVRDNSRDGIDYQFEASGDGVDGADDEILGTSWIGQNRIPGFDNGWFVDTDAANSNDYLYVRIWNKPAQSFGSGYAPSSAGTYYGDSEVKIISVGGLSPPPQDFYLPAMYTDTAIPEPGTLSLLGLGMLMVAARRRMKK